jgi:hypothetical protein
VAARVPAAPGNVRYIGGPLSFDGVSMAALGDTLAKARDVLAETLMIALEIGVDGLPADWSGIRLLTTTRKTYPVTALSAG